VVTREELLADVWNVSTDLKTRTIDTHVKRLRAKLGSARDLLETVRGVGFRLVTEHAGRHVARAASHETASAAGGGHVPRRRAASSRLVLRRVCRGSRGPALSELARDVVIGAALARPGEDDPRPGRGPP
jgi:hypothetical protein